MPEYKDVIGYVLSFLNIVVSGLFSWLVLKVLKQQLVLSKNIHEIEETKEERLRQSKRRNVIRRYGRIGHDLAKLSIDQKLNLARTKAQRIQRLIPSMDDILGNFNFEERDKIFEVHYSLEDHISDYVDGQYPVQKSGSIAKEINRLVEFLEQSN